MKQLRQPPLRIANGLSRQELCSEGETPRAWSKSKTGKLGRNLEIRVRGLNNKKLPSRPITAPTSQVGEVAVVRTPVSYKCGRGLNNKKSPLRPLKTTSLRGNSHSTRSNPEQISQLIRVGWVKPNNNNMDCRVASAPRNDIQLVGLPTSQNTFTPDAQLARSPRPFGERAEFVSEPCELRNSGEGLKNYHSNHYPPTPFGYFPRKGGRGYSVQLALNQFAVIQSPTAIQGRRISKTFSNPVTYTSKELSSRTCFGNLPALTTSTHPNLPSREGTCAVAHLTPMSLAHLVTWSLDHCPQREVCA